MKQSMTLQQLATEISRQNGSKRDFILPSNKLSLRVLDNQVITQFAAEKGQEMFSAKHTFHDHLMDHVKIDSKYYRRMLSAKPELLCQNVNAWLVEDNRNMTLRTLDGNARALLSNAFKPMDNYDLASNLLPLFDGHGLHVESCDLDDKHMRLKLVSKGLKKIIKTSKNPGEHVHFGVSITNSEIGYGRLGVEGLLWTYSCRNGAIMEQIASKYHVGARQGSNDMAWEVFADETKKLSQKAFWAQVKDVVKNALDTAEARFEGWAKSVEKTTDVIITSPTAAVEIVKDKYRLTETEQNGVLDFLVKGGDLSLYGLFNAVTEFAQDKGLTYARATELEGIGGELITTGAELVGA